MCPLRAPGDGDRANDGDGDAGEDPSFRSSLFKFKPCTPDSSNRQQTAPSRFFRRLIVGAALVGRAAADADARTDADADDDADNGGDGGGGGGGDDDKGGGGGDEATASCRAPAIACAGLAAAMLLTTLTRLSLDWRHRWVDGEALWRTIA